MRGQPGERPLMRILLPECAALRKTSAVLRVVHTRKRGRPAIGARPGRTPPQHSAIETVEALRDEADELRRPLLDRHVHADPCHGQRAHVEFAFGELEGESTPGNEEPGVPRSSNRGPHTLEMIEFGADGGAGRGCGRGAASFLENTRECGRRLAGEKVVFRGIPIPATGRVEVGRPPNHSIDNKLCRGFPSGGSNSRRHNVRDWVDDTPAVRPSQWNTDGRRGTANQPGIEPSSSASRLSCG